MQTGGRGRRRGQANADERPSEHAKEMLQQAARTAAEYGRSEVDTEAHAARLTGSEVARTVLEQFKINPDEVRRSRSSVTPRVASARRKRRRSAVSPRAEGSARRSKYASGMNARRPQLGCSGVSVG